MLDSFIAKILAVSITTALPISELRGGIPFGLSLGLSPFFTIITAIVVNCLIFFPIYFGLELLYDRVFCKWTITQKIIRRTQKKGAPYVEKYGILGLAIFVAIPLPVTGVWTGTLLAWLLGLGWKKSFIAICAGVIVAAVIVSAISLGFLVLSPHLTKAII